MKKEISKIIELSFEELKSKIGKTYFDIIINVLKVLIVFISLWGMFEYYMNKSVLINSYPYVLWFLSGFIPTIYILDVLIGSVKYKYDKPFVVINVSSFMLFVLLTFLEVVIFRLCGFEIDIYYLELLFFMILSFIFLGLCSIIIVYLGKINEKINRFICLLFVPIVCFSGLFFSSTNVHNRLLERFLIINPFYYITKGFRNSLIYKKWLFKEPEYFAIFIIINLFLIILCYVLNKLNKKK